MDDGHDEDKERAKLFGKGILVDHAYSDFSTHQLQPSEKRKGRVTFPMKLHAIVSNPKYRHIICWQSHGRSWKILDKELLASVVCKENFNHSNFDSINRSINGWGFKRITREGLDHKSYYHELFLRGRPELAQAMTRSVSTGRKIADPKTEPNFYEIAKRFPLPDCHAGDRGNSLLTDDAPAPPENDPQNCSIAKRQCFLSRDERSHMNPSGYAQADRRSQDPAGYAPENCHGGGPENGRSGQYPLSNFYRSPYCGQPYQNHYNLQEGRYFNSSGLSGQDTMIGRFCKPEPESGSRRGGSGYYQHQTSTGDENFRNDKINQSREGSTLSQGPQQHCPSAYQFRASSDQLSTAGVDSIVDSHGLNFTSNSSWVNRDESLQLHPFESSICKTYDTEKDETSIIGGLTKSEEGTMNENSIVTRGNWSEYLAGLGGDGQEPPTTLTLNSNISVSQMARTRDLKRKLPLEGPLYY